MPNQDWDADYEELEREPFADDWSLADDAGGADEEDIAAASAPANPRPPTPVRAQRSAPAVPLGSACRHYAAARRDATQTPGNAARTGTPQP